MPTPNNAAPATVATGTNGTSGPDIFDQVAAQQQPNLQPTQQTNNPGGSGDIFDQVAALDAQAAQTKDTGTGTSASESENPLLQFHAGIGQGAMATVAGLANVAGKVSNWVNKLEGGQNSVAVGDTKDAQKISDWAHGEESRFKQEGQGSIASKAGYGGETLAEFLMGDEALKGLSMSERLMQTAKTMKIFEKSPRLMQALKIGAGALQDATAGAGQGFARSGGDVSEATEEGLTSGALGGAVRTIPAMTSLFSTKAIQAPFQQGIRDVLQSVAQDAGVQPSQAASIRDVAGEVANAVEAKSKALYQELDQATGGRFQRFQDELKNINSKLRETAGLDDENEAALMAKKLDIEQKQAQVFEAAKKAGVNPAQVENAKLTWKQAQALFDLDNQLKMSATGLRPELATNGVKATEALEPARAANRLDKLYNSGRLQDAVGDQQAKQLVQHAHSALQQSQKIASRVRMAKRAAIAAGAGAVGYGAGHHVLHTLE